MLETILQTQKGNFEAVLGRLHDELSAIRTGRANPALLSSVVVESYGATVPLSNVASVSIADAKTIVVSPWDKGQMQAIEKGIMQANLGLTPNNDGSVIRLNLPPMTEERRKEMVKIVGQIGESARIGIRQVREDAQKAMKKAKENGDVGEDDLTHGQKKLQVIVDEFNEKIKSIITDKEKEILTV